MSLEYVDMSSNDRIIRSEHQSHLIQIDIQP
jgi:hypothetical protein